jgi:hypothetical protein
MAQMAPQIYNLPELHRGMLSVLGIKNAEKIVPLEEDQKPTDPVTENQNILKLKPVKAFLHQDHDAHIAVHNMMMQDPLIAAQLGQNPQAQQLAASLQAHIAEHIGYKMRKQIEAQLGMPLPPEDEKLPPQMEIALSSMMAQAAAQVVQQGQQQAAQMQAQQQAQDPVIQMQQQELQLRAQELQIKQEEAKLKAQKLMADITAQSDKLELETERVKGDLELRAMKTQADIEKDKALLVAQQEREGVRMGIDIARAKTQEAAQRQKGSSTK